MTRASWAFQALSVIHIYTEPQVKNDLKWPKMGVIFGSKINFGGSYLEVPSTISGHYSIIINTIDQAF